MPSEQLEVSYSPRRQRMVVVLAALSATFAIAGVLGLVTLSDEKPGEQAPAAPQRDLVTDGLGGPIAIETQAPTTRQDLAHSTAVVTGESRPTESAAPPSATPGSPLMSRPSFSCDTWSSVIHPGGTKRIGCDLYPAAHTGSVAIRCGSDPLGRDCQVEPSAFDLRGKTAPIRFEVVFGVPYETPASTISETIRMIGGSGQQHAFDISVPAVTGVVEVACPLSLSVPGTGTTPMSCTLTSMGGFDGYVRLSASPALPVGSVGFEPLDVRVPLGVTVDATVPLVSSGLPVGPLALSVDVTPVAWSAGPVSVALLVTV